MAYSWREKKSLFLGYKVSYPLYPWLYIRIISLNERWHMVGGTLTVLIQKKYLIRSEIIAALSVCVGPPTWQKRPVGAEEIWKIP